MNVSLPDAYRVSSHSDLLGEFLLCHVQFDTLAPDVVVHTFTSFFCQLLAIFLLVGNSILAKKVRLASKIFVFMRKNFAF